MIRHFPFLTIVTRLPRLLHNNIDYHHARIQCTMPRRFRFQLNWINSLSVVIMAFNFIFWGREKIIEISTTDSGVPCARTHTHIISWDIFIYFSPLMVTEIINTHNTDHAITNIPLWLLLLRPLLGRFAPGTVCFTLVSLQFWFYIGRVRKLNNKIILSFLNCFFPHFVSFSSILFISRSIRFQQWLNEIGQL